MTQQNNMEKINITLNLSKIDKSKIFERTYKNKDGEDITEKLYKFELIKNREDKFIAEGDTWIMKKTHFGAETQTKEEKAEKKKTNYVAEGFMFENKEPVIQVEPLIDPSDGRDITPTEDIPF